MIPENQMLSVKDWINKAQSKFEKKKKISK